jgi:hypothetical protein
MTKYVPTYYLVVYFTIYYWMFFAYTPKQRKNVKPLEIYLFNSV